MSNPAPITLEQLFRHKRPPGVAPHQDAAIPLLEADLKANGYGTAMRRDREWYRVWSVPPTVTPPNPLNVPYDWQLDNGSGQGFRECATSSCGMVALYWGKITSVDAYGKVRSRYGDTTDIQAHVAALRSIGLDVRFVTNGTAKLLETEIEAGRPVPVGWYHKGLVSAPSGGGHWSVVIGFNSKSFIHHDPNGEADMVNGGYVSTASTAGRGIRYSRRNFGRRWEADGPGSGWALLIKPA